MAKKTLTQQTQTLDGHSGLGDEPNINNGLNATQLKTRFDRDVNRNKDYINGTLISELQATTSGSSGAHAIGFDGTNDNVGDMLTTIIAAGSGSIPPDGTITQDKQATTVKTGLLADLNTTEKSTLVGAINEIFTDVAAEQYAESNAEQTSTSTSYVDALSVTITKAGDYVVDFLADTKSSDISKDVYVQILHQSTTLYKNVKTSQYTLTSYQPISGIAKITASASDTLKIQYKAESGGTAYIKNARLHIKKYLGS